MVLVGPHPERTEAILRALAAQDRAAKCEVVAVALGGVCRPPAPPGPPVRWVSVDGGTTWGAARAAGVRASRAPVVAFIEDHCLPEPGWAAAVVRAFDGGSAAVGYAFTNGSPDTFRYRTILFTEYGPWMHPTAGGEVPELSGNNVAYRRDVLLGFGNRLGELLEIDFNLHRLLRARGESLWLAPDAVVAHQSHERLWDLFRGHFVFARLLAVQRADGEGWSGARRLAHALAAPLAVPPLRLVRAWRAVGRQPGGRRRLLSSLPMVAPLYLWASLGESTGCVLGAGRAGISFATMELEWPRAARRRVG